MRLDLPEVSVWLPFAASAAALVFAVVILGDTAATIVLNGLASPDLPQSPTVMRYAVVHLLTGAAVLAGAGIALIAMESRSRTLLLIGEVFTGAALATIVVFEKMSLWSLPYLD